MEISIEHEGRSTPRIDYQGALVLGYPADIAGAALKVAVTAKVVAIFNDLRAKLSSDQPAKIAEWTVKQKIADDPSLASVAMLASIDAEAAARGTDRAGLFAIFQAKATALEETVLAISAMEASALAAVAAIADADAAIETQTSTILTAASNDAQAAYSAALAAINGGS